MRPEFLRRLIWPTREFWVHHGGPARSLSSHTSGPDYFILAPPDITLPRTCWFYPSDTFCHLSADIDHPLLLVPRGWALGSW